MVLRPGPAGLELLLIRRADRAGDPWSGHMALPGGRREAGDADDRDTAARETREEVGIDLADAGELLGTLESVEPRGGPWPVRVFPSVWAVPAVTAALPSGEVAAAFWVPLAELTDPASACEHLHVASGTRFPALRCGEQLVWGLTYRILAQLLEQFAPPSTALPHTVTMPHEPFTLQLTGRQAEALRALAAREELPPEVYAAEVLVKHLYHAYTPEVARSAPPQAGGDR